MGHAIVSELFDVPILRLFVSAVDFSLLLCSILLEAGLSQQELTMVTNLQVQTADEAKKLIPSLDTLVSCLAGWLLVCSTAVEGREYEYVGAHYIIDVLHQSISCLKWYCI